MPKYRIEWEYAHPPYEDVEAPDFASADRYAETQFKTPMPVNGERKRIGTIYKLPDETKQKRKAGK